MWCGRTRFNVRGLVVLFCCITVFGSFETVCTVHADVIVQWNFNSVPPDGTPTTGTNVTSVGSGTAALIGGTAGSFSTGSTNDPATSADDSGWQTTDYPVQSTGDKTAGVEFYASTAGYTNIVVRWDQRVTTSASKYYRLQYTTDGNSLITVSPPITMIAAPSTQSYYETQTNSFAGTPGVANNPNFRFRIVSEFQFNAIGSGANAYVTVSNTTYSPTSGNVRFDYVTVSGTLIPGGNTPPTITGILDQTIRVTQSTGPLSFTVLDAEDPAANLTLNGISANQSIIPNGNIVFGGSSSSRTVNVTAGNQAGSSTITVWVIDTGGKSNSTSFVVTVLPANTAPVISTIPPTNTLMNTPAAAVAFTVGDAETSASSLTVTGSSANLGLVPNGNIVFGGSASNRTVTVTPTAGQFGIAPITVTVSDGTNSASSIFGLMVRPSAPVLFLDSFSYPDGSIITNSGFLWDNRSGSNGQCQTISNKLQVTADQTEDITGQLAGAPYAKNNGTVLYAAFKATFLTLPKTTPDYFAHFASGSTFRGRIYAGVTPTNAPGSLRLFLSNASDTNAVSARDINTNTPYLLVLRYNIDTATATLWVNPSSESDPGTTAVDSQSATTISSFNFRQDSGYGATILVDDFKAGLSFVAVTDTNLPPASGIPLNFQKLGNNLILTWTNSSFVLQSANAVSGSYSNITGATSPYTNPISTPPKFFRLKSD